MSNPCAPRQPELIPASNSFTVSFPSLAAWRTSQSASTSGGALVPHTTHFCAFAKPTMCVVNCCPVAVADSAINTVSYCVHHHSYLGACAGWDSRSGAPSMPLRVKHMRLPLQKIGSSKTSSDGSIGCYCRSPLTGHNGDPPITDQTLWLEVCSAPPQAN